MRIFLALVALLWSGGALARVPTGPIDQFIDRALPASGAPGVAYVVVDGPALRSGAHGTVAKGSVRRVTPDTPFLIGSISKSFTALAVMQLVEAGKLRLDDRIAAYLPAFRGKASGSITIRQLLDHTSGYSTVQGNRAPDRDDSALSAYAARVAAWPLASPPGSRWQYSNTNYRILGALIEAVSNQTYAEYITAHILNPLEMRDSFVGNGNPPTGIAIGHRPWFGGKRAYDASRTSAVNAPAGGIFASANDLGRYLAMMIDGRDDILSARGKAMMLRPASDAAPFYGLGWFIDPASGTAWHDGLVPGTETLATLSPATGKAVAVLVNANGGIGFGETVELRRGITALALGTDYDGEGARLWPKATYLLVMALPLFYLLAIGWAVTDRAALRAKSGLAGRFSLWFPLVAMLGVAALLMLIVPVMFGGSIGTLLLFQPDFADAMITGAALGVLWAVVRLLIAFPIRFRPR